MSAPTIAIIGTGNMGGSLIRGLLHSGHPSECIWASDPNLEKLQVLQHSFHLSVTTDNAQAVEKADCVIFAIKPQQFSSVATGLAALIQRRKPLVVSIAAGIPVANIQHWIGGQPAIVRTMPNIASILTCGATALYANPHVSEEQRSMAESIMRTIGVTVWLLEEGLMDTVTALSGNGPAYFFLVMEALQEAATQLGLPHETARLLTLETAFGAARMAMESNRSLVELRHQVTSPQGTTEKAVSVLEDNDIRGLFKKALQASMRRSEELATLLKEDR